MGNQTFRFKQFEIVQDKTAMKVGTDGILLGAWVSIPNGTERVLDIGSGTGLISLMVAQRCAAAFVCAVELNQNAYIQSLENFEKSIWADRLSCYHTSVQQFALESVKVYDLIISNPPFFAPAYGGVSDDRVMARHTEALPYEDLLKSTSQLLSDEGICAFIIPYQEEKNFLNIAKTYKLYPKKITRVKGNESSKIKRSLLELTFVPKNTCSTELIIETERHQYTKEYCDIVKDFYLYM